MLKVSLQPIDDTVTVPPGSLLLPALLGKKLNVAMSCGGNGICSTCHVRVREGMDQLSPVGAKERRTLALVTDADPSSRLACQTHVHGDGVVVELPHGMYIEKADDLLALLGSRAPANILHPIRGHVLIPQGKIITRTLLEQSRSLDDEVRRMRDGLLGRPAAAPAAVPAAAQSFAATGRGTAPRQPEHSPTPPPPAAPPAGPITTIHGQTTIIPPPRVRPTAPAAAPSPPTSPSGAITRKVRSTPEVRLPPPRQPAGRVPSSSTAHLDLSAMEVVSVSLAAGRDKSASHSSRPAQTPPPAGVLQPVAGSRVGKFLLVECVGRGGLGLVYRALHTTLNVPVAVKFLRNRTAGAVDEFLDRFRAEARLLAQLNHPNVVRVLDYEDDPALPYVVMEFVEGLSIQDLLAQTGRIWWERAVTILLQAVDGLEAAGRLGIVHRDVKPGNILVARDGTAKVVDLGLAVRIDPQDATPAAGPPTHMDGTLAYMCPERARNPAGIDIRADIYSLGITFFQMVTGRLPFDGSSVFRVLAAHAGEPMPAAHETAPDVPPAVSEVIRQMTAKQPEDRYQSYEEVRIALLGLRGHPAGAAARALG